MLGLGLAGTTLGPSIAQQSRASEDLPPQFTPDYDLSSCDLLTLPPGFQVMKQPVERVMWNGKWHNARAYTQKLRTLAYIDLTTPNKIINPDSLYSELTKELRVYGYTHLYQLATTYTLYNPASFMPCKGLLVRGCCLV